MADGTQWNNSRDRTFLDYRKGGPGNPWLLFDDQGEMSAPSGGGQSVESRWGRGKNGNSEYKGAAITDNPARFEFDMMYRLNPKRALFLQQIKCSSDVRVRQRCGDYKDLTAYEAIISYLDSRPTSKSYSAPLANNAAQTDDDIMDTLSMSAAFEVRLKKLVHLSATGTNVDAVINQVISVSVPQCPGDCGDELTGEDEFWCVTSQDSTPGYLTQPAAQFGYRVDRDGDWTFTYIQLLQNADARSLVQVGSRVFVASPQGGIVYARIQDIKDGVALPWTRALAGGANGPRFITATPNGTLWAAGLNGYIYRSTDGGFTWTTYSAGTITTNQLNYIAAANDDLVWFAGNTGTLVRYQNGTLALVTTGLSAHLNTIKVPDGREDEVYFGTAAGRLYRSRNSTASNPTIAELPLDMAGSGSIEDIAFAGYMGNVLFILQSRADGKTRVLRDLSGGAAGNQVEVDIGSFDSPTQNGLNSIAPANENYAVTVGELVTGYGWIGVVSAPAA